MRREVKIGLLALLVMLTTIAALSTVAYMAPSKTSNPTQNSKPEPPRREFDEFPPRREIKPPPQRPWLPVPVIPWAFLKNATPTTYTGKIIVVSDHILALNVTGEAVNIIMAQKWILNGKVLTLGELFKNGTLSLGQQVTISALVYSVNHIYFAFGYKITIGTTTIPALLPFNIR